MTADITLHRGPLRIPLLGVLLIAVLAPFDQLQRNLIPGLSLSKLIFIFTLFFFALNVLHERRKIYLSPLAFPLFLYSLAYVSGLFRTNITVTANTVLTVSGYILLFFLVVNSVRTKRQVLVILISFILSLSFIWFLALYEALTGFPFAELGIVELKQSTIQVGKIVRLYGASKNPNEFATLLTLSIPMCFGLFITDKRPIIKLFLLLSFPLGLFSLFVSQSRSAILGTCIGLLFFSIFLFLYRINRKLFISFFLLGVMSVYAINHSPRLKQLNAFARLTAVENLAHNGRIQIWRESLKYIVAHPFGSGIGNSSRAIFEYSGEIDRDRTPHNIFLSAGTEKGWLGLLSVFLIFGTTFIRLGIAAKTANNKDDKVLLMAFMSAFISLFIHNQFHSLLGWNIVWLFWGLGFASIRINQASFKGNTQHEEA